MDKKIINNLFICFLVFFAIGFCTGYFGFKSGLDRITNNLLEQREINKRFRDFEKRFGITIEELPKVIESYRNKMGEIRTELESKDKIYREFIEGSRKNQSAISRGTKRIENIADSLRKENRRSIEIIKKYTE